MDVSRGASTMPSSRMAKLLLVEFLQVALCSAQTTRQCVASSEGTWKGGAASA